MRPSSLSVCLAAAGILLAASAPIAGAQSSQVTGMRLSNEKPIQIESDKLEIHEQEKKAYFDGNVSVVQGAMTLKSTHMVVFYKGGGAISSGGSDIDRIEVKGNVSVVSGTQSATGDTGSFDMRSELLTLEGKRVVLADGPNVFTGCKLTVQMKNGLAKLDSCNERVKILIDPKSRKNTN